MEAASLGIGIAALYTATIETLGRIDAYKQFEIDSQATLSRYEASKLSLEQWATAIGIADGALAEAHDPRLDEPRIAAVIQNILHCLRSVLHEADKARDKSRLPLRQVSTSVPDWSLPAEHGRSGQDNGKKIPIRSRIAWATGGKSKFDRSVNNFESLVNVLLGVLPSGQTEQWCKAPSQ